jgi:hypothetical protein
MDKIYITYIIRMKETIEPNEVLAEHIIEDVKEPYHDNNWDLVYLRNTRNSLLQLTDKYLIPDYPITPENLEIIKAYRQELRDYINKNKEGILNGVIPEIPPIPF